MRRTSTLLLCVWLVVGICATGVFAETVHGHVTYVSQTSVYVDLGSTSGLAQGNQGDVQRKGTTIAKIEVLFVADKTASCKISEKTSDLKEGDEVVFDVVKAASGVQVDTTRATQTIKTTVTGAQAQPNTTRRMRLTGQVAVQAYAVDDREASKRSFVQPLLMVNGRLEHIAQSWYSLSLLMRSRWTNHQVQPSGNTRAEWNTRVYEAALAYGNPESDFQYSIGRIRSNRISGIGDFDGGELNYDLSSRFSMGGFAGTQPNLQTSEINTKYTRYGLYSGYETGDYSTLRLESVLALAGEYYKGTVSREFLYEQLTLSQSRAVSVFESGELTINRGWRKQVEHKSLQLSNLLFNVRYSPAASVAVSLNYDNRTNYRTYETKTTPDTLFDNHLQQGFWAGVEYNPFASATVNASSGLRKRQGESQTTQTNSVGIMVRDIAGSGVYSSLRVNTFKNNFSNGYQPGLSFSRTFFSTLDAGVEIGQDHYSLKLTNDKVRSNWLKVNASYMISRLVYAAAYAEMYRGGGLASNRYFAELGYRL